jgi:hypothetical protein
MGTIPSTVDKETSSHQVPSLWAILADALDGWVEAEETDNSAVDGVQGKR